MKNHFLAFLGGAAIGAAVALLLAPKSGKELRKDLKGYMDDELEKGKKLAQKGRQKVSVAGVRMSETIREAAEDFGAEPAARKARAAAKK